MEEITYYFQIKEAGKAWDEIKPIQQKFHSREVAVACAKALADWHQKEVRMTDNEKLLQGSYFSPNK